MNNLNFRAWHKEEKRMHEVLGISLEGKSITSRLPWASNVEHGSLANPCIYIKLSFDEVILMQSTGQKGKGDIEIFDGDIFEYDILNGAYIHEVKGIVKYDYEEGCWKFILREQITNNKPDSDKLNEFSYMSLDEIYYPHLEIIGNIYEQPELLGGRE